MEIAITPAQNESNSLAPFNRNQATEEHMVTSKNLPEGSPGDEKDYVDGAPDRPDNPVLALIHDLRYGTKGVKSRAMWLVGTVGALVVVLCIGGLLIAFARGGSATPNNIGGAFPTAPAGDDSVTPPAPAPTGSTPSGWSPIRGGEDMGFILEINHENLGTKTLVSGDGSTVADISATFDGTNAFVNLAGATYLEGDSINWAGATMTVAGANPPGLRFVSVPSSVGVNTASLKLRLDIGEVGWFFTTEQGQVFSYKLKNLDGTNMELVVLTPQVNAEGALDSFSERATFTFAVNVEGVGGLTQNGTTAAAQWAGYQVSGPDGQPTGQIDWILP